MVSVNCPSCGGLVTFRAEYSTHAVCGACDSLLVRQGAQVGLIGKVAELQPDGSPLRLGTRGTYQGKVFELVGRIQLSYGDGYWNEWHLLYADGETGWLGEAMGEYFINSQVRIKGGIPPSQGMAPGDGIALGGEAYVVTGQMTTTLSSFEGELPFIVEGQTPFLSLDLRSTSGKAATVDYSEEPPLLFMGEYLPFDAFAFQGLRLPGEGDDEVATVSARDSGVSSFNCPSCGAPHTVAGGVRSKVLVCEYCGSAVDISSPQLQIMWQEQSMRDEVQKGITLPLRSTTRLDGEEFVLIGFIKKAVTYEGIKYPWVEYLLYNPRLGYRWLTESDGHYTLLEPMAGLPQRGTGPVTRPDESSLTYQDREYKHFQTSNPRVEAVAGEFYWRVRRDDTATNFDYISPPYMLSLESSESGFVWSHGRYLPADEVHKMFALSKRMRPAVGVAPCQPNPHDEAARSNWKVFWVAIVLGFLITTTGLLSGGGKTVWTSQAQTYQTMRTFAPQESAPFTLSGSGNLAFDFEGRMSQRWMFFDARLVDAATGKEATRVGKTVENYFGNGEPRRTVRVSGVPAGEYRLRWTVQSGTTALSDKADPGKPSENVSYTITLRRGVPVWGWFVLLLIVLIPIPIFESARRSSFETRRWYNSDHS